MTQTSLVDSHGCLDLVAIEDAQLRIDGWAASFEAGAVEGFKVHCAGRVLTTYTGSWHLPSPDVQAVHPSLVAAGRCRFQLRVPLTDEIQARARASVIGLTPIFQGQEGRIILRILEPRLPLPTKNYATYIGGAFMEVAAEFLGHFIERAGLLPDEHVLDVGCGVGRMAFGLAHYLSPAGKYEGFDIVEHLVQWCQETITPHVPNFHFCKVEVYNQWYNPGGTLKPDRFAFPYASDSFDFVFLTSVFTHMRGPEMRHYLEEIYRVLKPGARCLCTFFLLNEESEQLIQAGKSSQQIVYPLLEDCFTARPDLPEHAIGFKESLVLQWLAQRGFTVRAQYGGHWCGRARFLTYQDMLILVK